MEESHYSAKYRRTKVRGLIIYQQADGLVCNMRKILYTYGSGSIAQLGEHLPYKQGVTGSSPVTSTKKLARAARGALSMKWSCEARN